MEARVFICESTSRSWLGGRVLKVREMASKHVRFGGRSTPTGRGGREEAAGGIGRDGGGIGSPFVGSGGGWYVGCED